MTTIFTPSGQERRNARQGARFPHLQRFAHPSEFCREEPTTICGDILHAARTEVERLGSTRTPAPTLEALLGVISYCYTKGLFSSAAIERELWKTPAFLKAFGNRLPNAEQIRQFRRTHRPAILDVIEHALAEFSQREPDSVRARVIAANGHLADSTSEIARWLLDMANLSDEDESD